MDFCANCLEVTLLDANSEHRNRTMGNTCVVSLDAEGSRGSMGVSSSSFSTCISLPFVSSFGSVLCHEKVMREMNKRDELP